MRLSSALKPYPIFRLVIPLATGIFLSDTLLRPYDLLAVHALVMSVLLLLLLCMLRSAAYSGRWIFGGMVSLFLLVLGSFVTQMQWQAVDIDWPLEKNGYKGVMLETPRPKEKTVACKVKVDEKDILLYLYKDSLAQEVRCGDEIMFYSKIVRPHNAGNPYEFDYASYLLRKQISGTAYVYSGYWARTGRSHPFTLKQKALACRDKMIACYRKWGFGGEELAVLSALTVGYKDELSDELRESYSVAGVSHILALSGLHVGILWFLLSSLLRPLNRKVGTRMLKWFIITLVLWSFAFVAGLMASVVRAVVMCMLIEFGRIGRSKVLSLNILAVAAFFMLLYSPFYLFDVSFQLSFMAAMSISLFYSRIYKIWPVRNRILKYIWGVVAVSVAAQLGTAPLIMYYFSSFSVYFLFANLIVAPLIPFILYMSVAAFLFSYVGWLHPYIITGLKKTIMLLNGSAEWISRLPSASIDSLYLSSAEVCLLYGLLLLGFVYWLTKNRSVMIGLLAGTAFLLAMQFYIHLPKETAPSIVFYNVRNCSAVHFIDGAQTSYLAVDKRDSIYIHLNNIAKTYWDREKMQTPHVLLSGYESKRIWNHEGITHWRGLNICLLADNRWQNKTASNLLNIDYMYLCKGYKGKIAPLLKLFRIKKVVLDASLSDYKSNAYKEECKTLGLEFIDISTEGSFRIFL